ncbi:MAG: hypothetical protein H0Z39_07410 [Peptococcaceae bacterium]|nr:hypothetical protein [Peptococcaceae bacterium]
MAKSVLPALVPLEELGMAAEVWLKKRGFETQRFGNEKNVIVQARKGGTLSNVAGMAQALTVMLRIRNDGRLEVESGTAKWGDKALAGTVGFFAFFPLAITAGYGAYRQGKLVKEIHTFLKYYVKSYRE